MVRGKGKRAAYTLEYQVEAVRLIQGGQACSVTAKVLGIPKQTLENWVRLAAKGKLAGTGAKPVSAEQMELARLRAELARVKMERDILKTGAPGKHMIRRIHEVREALKGKIKLVYLEDYGIELAKLLTSGVDLWLNTPQPPLEASGTSGMKAAINGVPSFSILDGWWVEGCIEGVTGWAIGGDKDASLGSCDSRAEDAQALYNKLEMIILPMFCNEPDRYAEVMRHAIALNASFFNTERMLSQYITKAYFK